MAVIVVDAITQHGAELDAYEIADVLPCLARSASAARRTARPANDFGVPAEPVPVPVGVSTVLSKAQY